MPTQESQMKFLYLPLTARLRIYEYLLVCKDQVHPHNRPATDRPVTPSILRACKQIHNEASPALYSKNFFLVSEPERDLKWFNQIGHINITLLKRIRIFVESVYSTQSQMSIFNTRNDSAFWYKLLDLLAQKATGLQNVYIFWDTYQGPHLGAGKDLSFVRKLAKIQGLQSMTVDGCYAVHWPRYLAEKMGVQVQEHSRDLHLQKYQRDTEGLNP